MSRIAVPAGSGLDGPASEVKKRLNASMVVDGWSCTEISTFDESCLIILLMLYLSLLLTLYHTVHILSSSCVMSRHPTAPNRPIR